MDEISEPGKARSKKRLLLSCLLLLAVLGSLFYPRACWPERAEYDAKREQLDQLKREISTLTRQIEKDRDKKDSSKQMLEQVEKRLGKVYRALFISERDIKRTQRKLEQMQVQLQQLQTQLQTHRRQLAMQLKSAYLSGDRTRAKLLLSQQDPNRLNRISVYYDYLNKMRIQQILVTQETINNINTLSQEITLERQKQIVLKQEREDQYQLLTAQKKERGNVLKQVQVRLDSEEKQLDQLKASAKELETLIASLNHVLSDISDTANTQVAFSTLLGKLNWPVSGGPQNRFGTRRGIGDLTWHGLVIPAAEGTNVKAIAGGRVAFSDWLQGFGLMLIIDHDEGYLSLYGHNRVLFKEVGDWVGRGESIAQVGQSGGIENSALYFELRYKSQPVNPLRWLVKR